MRRWRLAAWGLELGVLLVLVALAVRARAGKGERIERRLEYGLRVWKGLRVLGKTVGTVTVETGTDTYEDRPCRLLRVRTRAKLFRFRVDASTHSYVDPTNGRQLAFHYLRTGSRRVESRLLFRTSGIEYHKWLRVGEPPKMAWEPLAEHPYDPRVCDMFAAFYAVRAGGLEVGGEPCIVRCVADRKLWDIAIRAVARKRVTVPAGTFDTLRLEVKPSPANDYTKTITFRGPFALGANTRLWIDPETDTLVKLTGTAHLALPVRAEIRLLTIEKPVTEE